MKVERELPRAERGSVRGTEGALPQAVRCEAVRRTASTGPRKGPDPEPAEGLARGHAQIQIKFAIKGINTYLGVCL